MIIVFFTVLGAYLGVSLLATLLYVRAACVAHRGPEAAERELDADDRPPAAAARPVSGRPAVGIPRQLSRPS